jgi:hypothetical protein
LNNISGDVVRHLGAIRKAIEVVSEYVTSTAAAVEEQNVVTTAARCMLVEISFGISADHCSI